MSEEQAGNELTSWLSTYGLITVERILEYYKIRLQPEDLLNTVKNPTTFYHRLLRVPLKNVLNGIILQQARDYQIYAQKLFIDYLLSGENGKGEDSPGGLAREDLEKEREALVAMGEAFHACELDHNKLIAETQKSLIQYAEKWRKILAEAARNIHASLKAYGITIEENLITLVLNGLLSTERTLASENNIWPRIETIAGKKLTKEEKQIFIDKVVGFEEFMSEIETPLADFINQTSDLSAQLKNWRTDFYKLILRVNDLIKQLPEYHYDQVQSEENRESLYFDQDIGES
ncbi:hypothetical protein [Legionella fairfieldensis]|uniref:hypothetical protein n=1 Tax=Legionella fairfieldensis TaxID=45064 RepID=UPI00048C5074|nr:hypothetical protein [Legionella fairfieldensis]